MVGQVELAFRIAFTAVVIFAPALLFLGLWRGLDLMRDDALIARLQDHGELDPSAGTQRFEIPGVTDGGGDSSTVRCCTCGTPNTANVTYCQQCLEKLS